MKANATNKIMIVVSVVAILGLGSYVYADWGMNDGHRGWHSGGSGRYHMEGYNQGHMRQGNMSSEDYNKLTQEYETFRKETEGLRKELYNKDLELRREMSKNDPDKNKVFAIQKDISELTSQLDKKALDFELNARNINPNSRMGNYDGDHMMSWGRGSGMGYGHRSNSNRNCW